MDHIYSILRRRNLALHYHFGSNVHRINRNILDNTCSRADPLVHNLHVDCSFPGISRSHTPLPPSRDYRNKVVSTMGYMSHALNRIHHDLGSPPHRMCHHAYRKTRSHRFREFRYRWLPLRHYTGFHIHHPRNMGHTCRKLALSRQRCFPVQCHGNI